MSMAEPEYTGPDRKTKRNIAVLATAQILLGSQLPINFILGGLAGQLLSPDKCWSTLPITMIVFGSMVCAPILSNIMQRYGRRVGFLIGAAGGAAGAAICATALLTGSFPLFLLGGFCTGIYMSSQGFFRFAAADGVTGPYRAKAISFVMAAALVSAIIGPQMVKLTTDALAPIPFAGAYAATVLLNIVGACTFFFLDSPRPEKPKSTDARPSPYRDLLRTPRIVVAIICAMVTYALMNLVMTSTPLAIVGCGFGTSQAADVVSAHVLAMYAPSFFTGHLVMRYGSERIITVGLLSLAAAGLAGLSGVAILNFYACLILLGIGWNFGFIGATTMLTGAYRPEDRGRVQGLNDFCVFGMVAVASLLSGGLMNCSGGNPVEGWQAVNLAMVPMLTLAGGALLWLTLSQRKPA